MEQLTLLLFLISTIFSARALVLSVDSYQCIHLRCEWRGSEKHCKSATFFNRFNRQKTSGCCSIVPGAVPLDVTPLSDDEPQSSILGRIQAEYPWSTFTVVNDDVLMGEKCKGWRLWCNEAHRYVIKDYAEFLKRIETRDLQFILEC